MKITFEIFEKFCPIMKLSVFKHHKREFFYDLRAFPSTSRMGLTSLIPHFSFPLVKYSSKAVIDFEKYLFASLFNGIITQYVF